MQPIQTMFGSPWLVRTPYVTRYLEEEYTEKFFKDGSLRLSSFKKFRQHPDEQRGDGFEGRATQSWKHPDGGTSAIIATNSGRCFVLCGTISESKSLQDAFANDGFRINNTLGFADAISRHIPGFLNGMEGLCTYRDEVLLKKSMPQLFSEEDEIDPSKAFGRMDRDVQEEAFDSFFLKRSAFAHQAEYRMIWVATGEEIEHIDIKCPEALRFCERLTTSSAQGQ